MHVFSVLEAETIIFSRINSVFSSFSAQIYEYNLENTKYCHTFASQTRNRGQKGTGCSAVGSAHVWGARGRKFESCHPDLRRAKQKCFAFLFVMDILNYRFTGLSRNNRILH